MLPGNFCNTVLTGDTQKALLSKPPPNPAISVANDSFSLPKASPNQEEIQPFHKCWGAGLAEPRAVFATVTTSVTRLL